MIPPSQAALCPHSWVSVSYCLSRGKRTALVADFFHIQESLNVAEGSYDKSICPWDPTASPSCEENGHSETRSLPELLSISPFLSTQTSSPSGCLVFVLFSSPKPYSDHPQLESLITSMRLYLFPVIPENDSMDPSGAKGSGLVDCLYCCGPQDRLEGDLI